MTYNLALIKIQYINKNNTHCCGVLGEKIHYYITTLKPGETVLKRNLATNTRTIRIIIYSDPETQLLEYSPRM